VPHRIAHNPGSTRRVVCEAGVIHIGGAVDSLRPRLTPPPTTMARVTQAVRALRGSLGGRRPGRDGGLADGHRPQPPESMAGPPAHLPPPLPLPLRAPAAASRCGRPSAPPRRAGWPARKVGRREGMRGAALDRLARGVSLPSVCSAASVPRGAGCERGWTRRR
jgi:hypothetical protein